MFLTKNTSKKVAIIGLDCATPRLLFDEYLGSLPVIKSLLQSGTYGMLRSTDPPITCPAWLSMVTGKNPGHLGIYGFRNRVDYSYNNLDLVTTESIKEDTLWDILGRYGKKSIIVGVPPSYPPRPLNGCMVSCFLTPDESRYTYPEDLKREIEQNAGGYIIDVENFRTYDKDRLLRDIYRMTESRFRTARYLLKNKEWDFFMMVDMGPDRLHHGFWKYADPLHRKYEEGNRFNYAIRDFYRYLDLEVGKTLELFDRDTLVLVVSDHGAKRLEGGIAINQWLIKNGYQEVENYPQGEVVPLEMAKVNWRNTKAWGEGGYYSRIFLNVIGREPQGIIHPDDYKTVRNELREKLLAITDEAGRNIGTKVFTPEELYGEWRGVAPDLLVYFGDLYWRSIGSVGHPNIYVFDNDTGPDDANHDYHGIFIMNGKERLGRVEGLDILDIAPTLLNWFSISVPDDMKGKII